MEYDKYEDAINKQGKCFMENVVLIFEKICKNERPPVQFFSKIWPPDGSTV